MKKFMLVVGALVLGSIVLLLAAGLSVTPEQERKYNAQRELERVCDEMMSDSALGSERRMTRQMCQGAREHLQRR